MQRLIDFLKIGPVFNYFIRVFKKDKEGKYPTSTNLKMMHGINKISILMFLLCIIIMLVRYFMRK